MLENQFSLWKHHFKTSQQWISCEQRSLNSPKFACWNQRFLAHWKTGSCVFQHNDERSGLTGSSICITNSSHSSRGGRLYWGDWSFFRIEWHELKSQLRVDPATALQNLFVRRYTATGVLEPSLKPAWRMKGQREACIPGQHLIFSPALAPFMQCAFEVQGLAQDFHWRELLHPGPTRGRVPHPVVNYGNIWRHMATYGSYGSKLKWLIGLSLLQIFKKWQFAGFTGFTRLFALDVLEQDKGVWCCDVSNMESERDYERLCSSFFFFVAVLVQTKASATQ